MQYALTADGEKRLNEYVERIGRILANRNQRASFAIYAMGIMGEGDRKSVEPIAARACPDPEAVDAMHQRLLHFLSGATWQDRDIRREAARHALPALTKHNPIDAWIIDDTGLLKQGTHSVGVQRQYTGSAGKVANCQIAVSLCVATCTEQLPIDVELYLPKCWLDDPARRAEARIPSDIKFKTKIELGLDMIRRAVEDGVPRGVVLADSFYGDSGAFRAEIRRLDLHYAVGVSYNLTAWLADKSGHATGKRLSLEEIAAQMPRKTVRKLTWREGTKKDLSARFAARRVVPAGRTGIRPDEREDVWLVIEWEARKKDPEHYYFVSLPRSTTRKRLVRIIKQRWRTEQAYQELKGEFGFDHYEGRRFCGWYHHVSVVLCCYAFVVAERSGAFSPSGSGTAADRQKHLAA